THCVTLKSYDHNETLITYSHQKWFRYRLATSSLFMSSQSGLEGPRRLHSISSSSVK
ncbi:Hypothetical protein FKW44_025288, partial [Caligus rogercresseyi]